MGPGIVKGTLGNILRRPRPALHSRNRVSTRHRAYNLSLRLGASSPQVQLPKAGPGFYWPGSALFGYSHSTRPIAGGGTSTSEGGCLKQHENQLHSKAGRRRLRHLFRDPSRQGRARVRAPAQSSHGAATGPPQQVRAVTAPLAHSDPVDSRPHGAPLAANTYFVNQDGPPGAPQRLQLLCELEHPARRSRPAPVRPPARPSPSSATTRWRSWSLPSRRARFTLKLRVPRPAGPIHPGVRRRAGQEWRPLCAALPFPGAAAAPERRLERHHRALRRPVWRAETRQAIWIRTCQHIDGWIDVPKVVRARVRVAAT